MSELRTEGYALSKVCSSMKVGARLASISMVSSGVSPHARQPGRSGISTMYLSGSVNSAGLYRM